MKGARQVGHGLAVVDFAEHGLDTHALGPSLAITAPNWSAKSGCWS
jgi:hypothetical protein